MSHFSKNSYYMGLFKQQKPRIAPRLLLSNEVRMWRSVLLIKFQTWGLLNFQQPDVISIQQCPFLIWCMHSSACLSGSPWFSEYLLKWKVISCSTALNGCRGKVLSLLLLSLNALCLIGNRSLMSDLNPIQIPGLFGNVQTFGHLKSI